MLRTRPDCRSHIETLGAAVLLLALGFGLPRTAAAQLELSSDAVYAGEPVTVSLPPGTDTLLVTYRPSSTISSREVLLTAGASQLEWTPSQAGIVALSAPGLGSKNVSVRFRSAPISGIFVLVLAGTILFGGAIFATYYLFLHEPRPDPAVRPDT